MTDPVMNPPAPSGRYDDSSLTTGGDRIALPAKTRMYVDAGGAKHFILPDGTTRYVPPGEVGNFYLEGASPQDAMRRHLVQDLPYVDAVRVNAVLDDLFAALDQARLMGVDFKLVPTNPGAVPELAKRLDEAYSNVKFEEYPKAKYHVDGRYLAVSEEDEGDLGGDWHDTPDDARKAASAREGSFRVEQDRQNPANDHFVGEGGFTHTGGVIKPDVAPADKPAPVA